MIIDSRTEYEPITLSESSDSSLEPITNRYIEPSTDQSIGASNEQSEETLFSVVSESDIENRPIIHKPRRMSKPLSKVELRGKLASMLADHGYNAFKDLFRKAEEGKLRDQDQIKLLETVLKYSIGTVTQSEVTGENGAPVKVEFSFGTNKPEAHLFLEEAKKRAEQFLNPTADEKSADSESRSDNDHSDI